MKKLMVLVVVLSLIVVGAAIAGVVSSKHDMRVYAGANGIIVIGQGGKTTTNQVCVFCHHPHRTKASGTDTVLLWNNDVPNTSYTTYSSPTANVAGQGGALGSTSETQYSRLCMGCHDGSSGINVLLTSPIDVSSSGTAATKTLSGLQADIGGDTGNLTNDHPVDFTYPTVIASTDDIRVPDASGTVDGTYPLYSGTMQCATCHAVHRGTDSADTKIQFMRGSTVNSSICIDCHMSK